MGFIIGLKPTECRLTASGEGYVRFRWGKEVIDLQMLKSIVRLF